MTLAEIMPDIAAARDIIEVLVVSSVAIVIGVGFKRLTSGSEDFFQPRRSRRRSPRHRPHDE